MAGLGAAALEDSAVVARSASATISSDESVIDFRTGISTFTGNVEVDHASFDLIADQLIEYRAASDTSRVIVTGSPARFKQKQPFSERISHGHARRIEYDATTHELKMWNYEVTDVDGMILRGDQAIYLLLENKEG